MMCDVHSFLFRLTSNCWTNAVIAHELYTMLQISHRRGRYDPPTQKKVALQTAYVYLYAAELHLWLRGLFHFYPLGQVRIRA